MSPLITTRAGASANAYGWGAAASGPVASFESIATATGTGSSGTITFSSIPSTYTHLEIRSLNIPSATSTLSLTANSLGSPNYSRHFLLGDGSATAVGGTASTSNIYVCGLFTSIQSTYPNVSIISILDYASTSKYKTARIFSGHDTNGGGEVNIVSGSVMTTSAISSLTLALSTGNFSTTSTFALYGIKAAA